MKMKHMVLTVLALGASALLAGAQDNNDGPPGGGPGGQGGPGGPGRHHPPLPLVKALDVNHDGVIDATELANASAALLTLDKNSDGTLSTDEYLPTPPKDAPADAPRPPQPLIVKALDVNKDGVLDATEIANASTVLKTLDKNADGELSRDEFIGKRPGHPPRGGMGGHGDEDGGPGGPPPDNN